MITAPLLSHRFSCEWVGNVWAHVVQRSFCFLLTAITKVSKTQIMALAKYWGNILKEQLIKESGIMWQNKPEAKSIGPVWHYVYYNILYWDLFNMFSCCSFQLWFASYRSGSVRGVCKFWAVICGMMINENIMYKIKLCNQSGAASKRCLYVIRYVLAYQQSSQTAVILSKVCNVLI